MKPSLVKTVTTSLLSLAVFFITGCYHVTDISLSRNQNVVLPLPKSDKNIGYLILSKDLMLSVPAEVQVDANNNETVITNIMGPEAMKFKFFEVEGVIYGESILDKEALNKTLLPKDNTYYRYVKLSFGEWEKANFEGRDYTRRKVSLENLKFDEATITALGGKVIKLQSTEPGVSDATLYSVGGLKSAEVFKAARSYKAGLFDVDVYQVTK